MTDTVGKLEEEALKRKERLRNLKRKQEASSEAAATAADQPAEVIPKPVFRNYRPESEEIKENAIDEVQPTEVEREISSQLEMMRAPIVIEEIDIANLAPRKPDWDLKRDVSKKLEKLERRTQKAIAELIRDRLKAGQEDIMQAVNVASSAAVTSREEEDD